MESSSCLFDVLKWSIACEGVSCCLRQLGIPIGSYFEPEIDEAYAIYHDAFAEDLSQRILPRFAEDSKELVRAVFGSDALSDQYFEYIIYAFCVESLLEPSSAGEAEAFKGKLNDCRDHNPDSLIAGCVLDPEKPLDGEAEETKHALNLCQNGSGDSLVDIFDAVQKIRKSAYPSVWSEWIYGSSFDADQKAFAQAVVRSYDFLLWNRKLYPSIDAAVSRSNVAHSTLFEEL